MISSTMHSESTRSPLQFLSECAELAQQHSAQQRVRNLIRARDTVLVTSELNPSGRVVSGAQRCGNLVDHHLLHSLTVELCDFLLVVTFTRDDPTRFVLHGTSDGDRTLLLLKLLHFFLKIHRLHLIALDRCEWPRTSPTSRAVGPSPSCNFVKHVIFGSLCTLWTFFPND